MKRSFRLSRHAPDVSRDVGDEIRFYLDMRTQELIDGGLTPEEARRKAVDAFGDLMDIERQCHAESTRRVRHQHRKEIMHSLWQDLRYAARTLGRSPGFTLAAVITLALGIGANTALFSVVNGVLLRPLPYPRGEQLLLLRQAAPQAGFDNVGFAPPEVRDYRAQNTTLAGVVEYHNMWFNLLGRDEPERVQTGVVSSEFFDVLGVTPILGRTFRPDDDRAGAEPVLVLSHEYWKRSFGGDSGVIGRALRMNDRAHTVIGVLPAIPQYPDENDVYMPVSACPFRSNPNTDQSRQARMVSLYGRLKQGVPVERAQADLAVIARRLQQQYPEAYAPNIGTVTTNALVLERELTRGFRPTLLVLMGTAGFVLLIVCASVANLSLARLMRREREMAIRAAIGAGRGRLVRQLLTESTLLALLAGVAGLGLAVATLGMLSEMAARFTPRAREIGIDARVLLFTLGVSLGTGLVFGVLPALFARLESLVGALRESGRSTLTSGKHRARNALIVAQVAISFMLLIGAGLALRSLWMLQQVDPGFRPENVLTMTIAMDFTKYNTPPLRAQYMQRLIERVQSTPGVVAASASGTFPLNEQGPFRTRFQVEGRPVDDAQQLPQAGLNVASPEYFRAIGIPLVAGRLFTEQDQLGTLPVAIVNQTMARHYWPNEDPIGQRLNGANGQPFATIVGVVGDNRQQLNAEVEDILYRPYLQTPFLQTTFLVRTAGEPKPMARRVVEAIYAVDREQPVADMRTLEEVRAESLASPRLTATLLALFAGLALVITATGIAGVIAYSVSERTHEIGIRMALGAQRTTVLRMLLGQGLALVSIGLALGVAGALALTRLMSGLLFGIGATDPLTFLAVSLVLLAVAVLACAVPARRATGIDPIMALRAG